MLFLQSVLAASGVRPQEEPDGCRMPRKGCHGGGDKLLSGVVVGRGGKEDVDEMEMNFLERGLFS